MHKQLIYLLDYLFLENPPRIRETVCSVPYLTPSQRTPVVESHILLGRCDLNPFLRGPSTDEDLCRAKSSRDPVLSTNRGVERLGHSSLTPRRTVVGTTLEPKQRSIQHIQKCLSSWRIGSLIIPCFYLPCVSLRRRLVKKSMVIK